MAKRFIDTDIFKKRFVRGLTSVYKLFWVYLFCECDNAGIWEVDLEVAGLYCGQRLSQDEIAQAFNGKIHFFKDGTKAFIPEFIEFQYGDGLNPNNPAHKGVIQKIQKYGLQNILSEGVKPQESPFKGASEYQESPVKEAPKPAKIKGKAFQRPTLEEVTAYCDERGNLVSPQSWIDFYTSNGWKVGKNPMKDWKAAVRTWERNGINNITNGRKGNTSTSKSGYNEVSADITGKKTRTSTI